MCIPEYRVKCQVQTFRNNEAGEGVSKYDRTAAGPFLARVPPSGLLKALAIWVPLILYVTGKGSLLRGEKELEGELQGAGIRARQTVLLKR